MPVSIALLRLVGTLTLLAAIATLTRQPAPAAAPYLRLVRVLGSANQQDLPDDLAFGLGRMAVDWAAGRRYALDERRPELIVSRTDAPSQPATAIALDQLDRPGRAVAFDPSSRRLQVLSENGAKLLEVTTSGVSVATRDLSELQLDGSVALAFASSGDPTDAPGSLSLYVAASNERQALIYELELAAPAQIAMPAAEPATLVQVVDTSRWSPPSPDPSGIAEMPETGRLIVSDGEVEEMHGLFQGANVFETSYAGALLATSSTIDFSNEPTGVAVDAVAGRLFFSDDNKQRVFEVRLGGDGRLGTADDVVTWFSTRVFGSTDPEGLAYGQNKLFVADGLGREIYIVAPGPNGRFDGVAPSGDDVVTNFDTARLDQQDPEGVEYNTKSGTLFIVSNSRHTAVVETTLAGEPLRVIDISVAAVRAPAGLAYAPSSSGIGRSLFIVDRDIDNNADPNENDGRLYELAIDHPQSTATRTPVPASPIPRPTLPAGNDIYLPFVSH